MAVEHVKSTPISNAEATPPVANLTGAGAAGYLREIGGYITAPASASVDSTFRAVRLPSTVKVKAIVINSQAQAAGKVDIGVYYPTAGPGAVADLAANAIDQDFFATAVDLASAVQPTDVTNESGTYTPAKQLQPLWQAIGLSADPRCMLDIVMTVVTTAVTTGTGQTGLSVRYVD